MYTCYCKILKKLKKIEEALNDPTTPGNELLNSQIRELREELEQNSQADSELREEFDSHLDNVLDIDVIPVTEEQVNGLFR